MFYYKLPNRIVSFALLTLIFVNGCSRRHDHLATQSAATTKPEQSTAKLDVHVDDITKFDFRNHTYPLFCDYAKSSSNDTFKLIEVADSQYIENENLLEVGLCKVLFDHVTRNSKSEEAIVILSPLSHGAGMYYWVYIYGTEDHKLKLLWSLEFGDRSDGGLRDIYGEKGNLVIETYNYDFGYGNNSKPPPAPRSSSYSYTRAIYEWTGFRYQLIEAKRMINSEDSASLRLSNLAKRQKG